MVQVLELNKHSLRYLKLKFRYKMAPTTQISSVIEEFSEIQGNKAF